MKIKGEAERSGTIYLGDEMAQEDLLNVYKYLMVCGGGEEDRARCSET